MKTFRIKSILMTLIMILVSGNAWADTYSDWYFPFSGIYQSETYYWSFNNIEAGSIITFEWEVSGDENELLVNINTPTIYESIFCKDGYENGRVSFICTTSGYYSLSAEYRNKGYTYGGYSFANIRNIKVCTPKSYQGLDFYLNVNNTDAYLT